MGQLNLKEGAIIYLDASIIIYTLEGNIKYLEYLRSLWTKFQSEEIEIMTSELTLTEILIQPFKSRDSLLIADYEDFLTNSSIQLISISRSILKTAAEIRATKRIKTPDAIHAATAIQHPCTMFLTNDRGFQNTARLPVVVLDQVIQS